MPRTPPSPEGDRLTLVLRALGRYRARLDRKLEGLKGDLAESQRAAEYRRFGETLLAYLSQVPLRASMVRLPDPEDPQRNLDIPLDPRLKAQENAARYFKRAAKAERGLEAIPPRLAAVQAELRGLEALLERASRIDEHAPLPEGGSVAHIVSDATLEHELHEMVKRLPPALRRLAEPTSRGRSLGGARSAARRASAREPSGRLIPRRLKSREGWDVMIGRSNEGNDYLTHKLARPEDYWFHVRGAAGAHVVLRRGKDKNEPSKRTIDEVAAWAAFYSQARNAGTVPVIVTRKKYVRRPRKGPPGLALCERERTVMVRPHEPPREALAEDPEGFRSAEG